MIFGTYNDVKGRVEKHPARDNVHEQWKLNYYYVVGKQYYLKREEEGKIENVLPQLAEERDNLTFRNKLFPIHQTWVATFTEKLGMSSIEMVPRTTDFDDRQKARTSEYFAKYYWDERLLCKKLLSGIQWFFITGNLFTKTYFDESMTAEIENKKGEVIKAKVGDIDTEVLNSFSILFDPYADNLADKNLRWIIEVINLSKEVAKERYGLKIEGIPEKPTYIDDFMLFKSDKWITKQSGQKEFEGVVVIETWEKQKNGKWRTESWANGERINKASRQDVDEHPYSQAKVIDFGMSYGETALPHALQIQRDYNKMYGMFLDQMQHTHPYLITSYNAEITKGKFEGNGIEHIAIAGDLDQFKIQQGLQINPSLLTGLQSSKQEINEVLSTNEQSMGRLPSGSSHTAGYTHSALMRQDAIKLMAPLSELEMLMKDVLMKALKLVNQFYTEERVVRVFGEEEGLRVMRMKSGSVGVSDIRVDFGSSFPYSKTETAQFLIQLVTTGMLPPEIALSNLGMGNIIKGVDDTTVDIRRIERNIDDVYLYTSQVEQIDLPDPQTGELVPTYTIKGERGERVPIDIDTLVPDVREWDNHEIQLTVLEREMKKIKFDYATTITQDVLKALRQKYIDFLQQKQQQQQPQPQQQQQANPEEQQQMVAEVVNQLLQGVPIETLANSYPPEILQMAQQMVAEQAQVMQEIQQKIQSGATPEQLVSEGYNPELIQAVLSSAQGGA